MRGVGEVGHGFDLSRGVTEFVERIGREGLRYGKEGVGVVILGVIARVIARVIVQVSVPVRRFVGGLGQAVVQLIVLPSVIVLVGGVTVKVEVEVLVIEVVAVVIGIVGVSVMVVRGAMGMVAVEVEVIVIVGV